MSVRTGMADMINYVRLHADLSQNEVTVNGVAYWTDQQIQDVLDTYRQDARRILLEVVPEKLAGVVLYTRYYLPDYIGSWIETGDQFTIVDVLGNAAPSYTLDLNSRVVIFDANTTGKTYYAYMRVYDIRPAIAEVWLMKAGLRTALIDWKAGGQSMNEDAEYKHCMEQYKEWSGYMGIKSVRMRREDYQPTYSNYIPGLGKVEPTNYG